MPPPAVAVSHECMSSVDSDGVAAGTSSTAPFHAAALPHLHAHSHARPSFPLRAIVFAEFDNTAGPKITCQAPERFLSDDLFDSISDFIITGPELCHKLVTVTAGDYHIIGYPMQLSHKKYHRNALLFNVAFVFPRDISGDSSCSTSTAPHSCPPPSSSQSISTQLKPYHAVIRKLANIIESLELESEFLFRPESKAKLQGIVNKIFKSLNACGEASVLVETMREVVKEAVSSTLAHPSASPPIAGNGTSAAGASLALTESSSTTSIELLNKITLKLYPHLALPPKNIPNHSVPIRVKDLDFLWNPTWDLTLRQIIPFIDGVNYVSKIATLSGIHGALVAKCIRQLIYYEAVQLIDIFQFSNRYTVTDKLRICCSINASPEDQLRVSKLRSEARRACRLDRSKPKPKFQLLFRLWSNLNPHITLAELFSAMPRLIPPTPGQPALTLESANIHPRKFIQFAVVNGLIRRVHLYPILVSQYMQSSANLHGSSNSNSIQSSPVLGSINSSANSSIVPIAPVYGSNAANVDHSFVSLIYGGRAQQIEEVLTRQLSNSVPGGLSSSSSNLRGSISGSSSITPARSYVSLQGALKDPNNPPQRIARDSSDSAKSLAALDNPSAVTLTHPTSSLSRSGSSSSQSYLLTGNQTPSSTFTSPPTTTSTLGFGSSLSSKFDSFRSIEKYLDGEHHMEQLCVMLHRSFAQLDEEIRKSKKCIIIYK